MPLGERTRVIDQAHVEFFRGVDNPVGVKIGPTTTESELSDLIKILNPRKVPGKITLITRLGEKNVEALLPKLIKAKQNTGQLGLGLVNIYIKCHISYIKASLLFGWLMPCMAILLQRMATKLEISIIFAR